jgi:Bax protein
MFSFKELTRLSASLLFMLSSSVIATTSLPISPEKMTQPYPEVKIITLHSAKSLIQAFERSQYQLSNVIIKNKLPAFFVENLPDDLNALPEKQKISGFIRLLLPTIVAVNKDIIVVRNKAISLSKRSKTQWTIEESAWLNKLMASYSVKSHNINELLLHLDIIPVGMVLAQGIDESGWGTSYFAINGNSLFGEHLSSKGGEYLTTPGGHVKVAAFDNLFAGMAQYMLNLNTTSAYKNLWDLRQKLRQENDLSGDKLVQSLSHYSTRGQAYVDNLRALIRSHQLDSFNNVEFNDMKPIRIKLSR